EAQISDGNNVDVKEMIIDALQNFEYDQLRFSFIPGPEPLDMPVSASAVGKGQIKVPVGGLEINVRNFGDGLNEALRLHAGVGQPVQQIKDKVEQQDNDDEAIMDLFR